MEGLVAGFPLAIAILFGVALVCCSIGFKKFVYFLSTGYGFAVAGIAIAIMVMSGVGFIPSMSWPTWVLCGLLVAYGCRLSGFLLYREIKSAAYKKKILDDKNGSSKKMPIFVLITIWLIVGVLYVQETSPIFYRIYNGRGDELIMPLVGASIMLVALVIETVADLQKSAAKKTNPGTFVSTGLYRFVRCPNYLGEILFWTGVLVSGVNSLSGWAQWVMAIIGYVLIVYVMVSGAKRLEIRQDKNYGNDPAYQAYKAKTPILMHLIPVKSIKNWKWIK
jgi:steroid 5-alpha reductase family enzyme